MNNETKRHLAEVAKTQNTAPSRLNRFAFALPLAVMAGTFGSAQTVTNPANGLDLTAPINAFGGAMTNTITTNSPALFAILALAVGFYFLWGRVRSLF